ncbi:hypothetical protein [Olivibacter sitiensis]|uniref:hypothetical protein n=1 Tax=Olivibacter sitiensis TaxID=376470 RepID=UPI0004202903|nr:hypothetical protein [Olivibacter sitiensis]
MKKFVPYLFFSILLSSCSTYYLSKVDTADALVKDDQSGLFIVENDSLKITYNFFGVDAPVNVEVYNKLNEPLYIDWQRSALIVDDYATSYMGDEIDIQGNSFSSGSGYVTRDGWTGGSSFGTFNAQATLPRGMDFIPPKARVERTKLRLPDDFFRNISNSEYKNQEIADLDGYTNTVKVSQFSPENTPLTFKSYLTVYVIDKSSNQPRLMNFEHEFYVSEVVKMKNLRPENMLNYRNQRGDTFVFREVKGTTAAVLIGSAALLGAAAAADNQINKKNSAN